MGKNRPSVDLLASEARPELDMDAVCAEIKAGRTPTCPDCGEALTHVPKPGALLGAGRVVPDPEAHRCDPALLVQVQRARRHRPGETKSEADRRREAELNALGLVLDTPPAGDEEDV